MAANELSPDAKGRASLTLGDVIVRTRQNFPDRRYHPRVYLDTPQYHVYGINPTPYDVWATADGIGTKPELTERLSLTSRLDRSPNFNRWGNMAFDTFAMIDGDEARFGRQLLGVANIIDMNATNPEAIFWLAVGARDACNAGRFALLNGETAELGYRTSGYSNTRLNWNAVGVSLVIPDKLILGQNLKPGQPLVAFRETSIRSNGLTKARAILEANFLNQRGYKTKEDYLLNALSGHLGKALGDNPDKPLKENITWNLAKRIADSSGFVGFLDELMGHPFIEQVLLPWHEAHNLKRNMLYDLVTPSTLYGKVIHEAQGWTDSPKQVDITAAAHITGGGIPEKVKRMVESSRLGAHIDPVFPEPNAIKQLLDVVDTLPEETRNQLITDREACQQWNRGIGFVVATKTLDDAERLVELASDLRYEAAVAGAILEEPKIEFHGHTWTY